MSLPVQLGKNEQLPMPPHGSALVSRKLSTELFSCQAAEPAPSAPVQRRLPPAVRLQKSPPAKLQCFPWQSSPCASESHCGVQSQERTGRNGALATRFESAPQPEKKICGDHARIAAASRCEITFPRPRLPAVEARKVRTGQLMTSPPPHIRRLPRPAQSHPPQLLPLQRGSLRGKS